MIKKHIKDCFSDLLMESANNAARFNIIIKEIINKEQLSFYKKKLNSIVEQDKIKANSLFISVYGNAFYFENAFYYFILSISQHSSVGKHAYHNLYSGEDKWEKDVLNKAWHDMLIPLCHYVDRIDSDKIGVFNRLIGHKIRHDVKKSHPDRYLSGGGEFIEPTVVSPSSSYKFSMYSFLEPATLQKKYSLIITFDVFNPYMEEVRKCLEKEKNLDIKEWYYSNFELSECACILDGGSFEVMSRCLQFFK